MTATLSPFLRIAWKTQATDAEAIGSGSNTAKTSAIGFPVASSMALMATEVGKGGQLSSIFSSSWAYT